MTTTTVHCDSCDVLAIMGFKCHELGCPDAWEGVIRECKWCGSEFQPEVHDQTFCDEECAESYN